jgi:hypothetical protein
LLLSKSVVIYEYKVTLTSMLVIAHFGACSDNMYCAQRKRAKQLQTATPTNPRFQQRWRRSDMHRLSQGELEALADVADSLAMRVLQSYMYTQNPDIKDCVDAILAVTRKERRTALERLREHAQQTPHGFG